MAPAHEPTHAVSGELWKDTATGRVMVRESGSWKEIDLDTLAFHCAAWRQLALASRRRDEAWKAADQKSAEALILGLIGYDSLPES